LLLSKRNFVSKLLIYISIIIIAIVVVFPMVIMISVAIKPEEEGLGAYSLISKNSTFENFVTVLTRTNFKRNILNSVVVSSITTVMCIMVTLMTGYALSRFKNKVFRSFSVLLLILQMIPVVLLIIPLFIIFKRLGLYNTYFSVILSYSTFAIPFSAWMLRAFINTIPFEIEESALIDGCNQIGSFIRVILPLSIPGIAAVGVFVFNYSWSEFLLASIFLHNDSVKTITVGMQIFREQYITHWNLLMAAATIASIPAFIVLVFAQRYLVQGLTAGSLKQ